MLRIDGRAIGRFEDMITYIAIRPEQPLRFDLERAGQPLTLTVTPRAEVQRDRFGNEARIGRIGLPARRHGGRQPAAASGRRRRLRPDRRSRCGRWSSTLGQLIRGQRSLQEMGGPLKIAQFSGQQASLGWLDFIQFMTLISINLGFINLLPIPLLDGGHLLFYAIEGVRRKPLKPVAQEWAFRTGLAVLLALMIFVTFNDLASFGLFTRLGGLIG